MKWLRPFDPPELHHPPGQGSGGVDVGNANLATKSQTQPPKARESPAHAILRRIEWTTLKRLDGLLQGDYRTLLRGVGLDLADLREYQFHDDVRHIDWNVTARMQTPYVRLFSEDRDMNAWFLVDLSPSADFGSGDRNKREMSTDFVALLARLITQHGNRTGLMLYGSTVDTIIPPRADRTHLLHMLHKMTHRPVRGVVSASGATQLHVLLERAAETIKRRSAIFIVSDFISEPGWEKPLARLAQKHDVVAVHITDPLEQTLPNVGLMTLEDPETGEQMFVDTTDSALRSRFAALAQERATQHANTFARAGVNALTLATDQTLIDNIVRFIERRKRQAGAVRGGAGFAARRVA
jgi:uncharacterized protein (DUF58 family)